MWTLAEANAAHAPNDIYIIVRVRTFITETWEDHVWNKKKPSYLRSSFAALALLTARQKLHNERRVHGPIPTRQRNAVIRLLLPPQIIMSDALLNRRVYDIGKAWPRCQQTNTLFSLQKSNSAISHGSKMPLSSFAIWNDLCRYPGGIKVLVSCARQQNVTGLVRKGLRKAAARQVGLCRLYSPIKLKHEFYHVQFSSWLTQPLHLRYKQWTPLFPCCGPWYAKKRHSYQVDYMRNAPTFCDSTWNYCREAMSRWTASLVKRRASLFLSRRKRCLFPYAKIQRPNP